MVCPVGQPPVTEGRIPTASVSHCPAVAPLPSSSLCSLTPQPSTCFLDRLCTSIASFFSSLWTYIARLFCGETEEIARPALRDPPSTPALPQISTPSVQPVQETPRPVPRSLRRAPLYSGIGNDFLKNFVVERKYWLTFPKDYRVVFMIVIDGHIIGVLGRNVKGKSVSDTSFTEIIQEVAPLLEAFLEKNYSHATFTTFTIRAISVNSCCQSMRAMYAGYEPIGTGILSTEDEVIGRESIKSVLEAYCSPAVRHNVDYSILLRQFLVEWCEDSLLPNCGFWPDVN